MNFSIPPPLIPTIGFILLGYFAKRSGALNRNDATRLIKFSFQLILPLVIFICFVKTKIDLHLMIVPLISVLVSSMLMLIAFVVAKIFRFEDGVTGGYLAASGITSTLVFALPFIQATFGEEGAKYLFLYDFGNSIMCYLVVYFVCSLYGPNKKLKVGQSMITFLKTPCVIATALGLYFSLCGLNLSPGVLLIYDKATIFFNVLLLLCIGMLVEFKYFFDLKNLAKLSLCAFTIMIASVFIAWNLINYFEITGTLKQVVMLCALAPAASISVAFAIEHKLDVDFTSALVAFTMAVGTIIYPLFFTIYLQ